MVILKIGDICQEVEVMDVVDLVVGAFLVGVAVGVDSCVSAGWDDSAVSVSVSECEVPSPEDNKRVGVPVQDVFVVRDR